MSKNCPDCLTPETLDEELEEETKEDLDDMDSGEATE